MLLYLMVVVRPTIGTPVSGRDVSTHSSIFSVISCLPTKISGTVVSSVATVTAVPGFRLGKGDTQETASEAQDKLKIRALMESSLGLARCFRPILIHHVYTRSVATETDLD